MTHRQFITLSLAALFLALAPTALASTTWFVNGVSGSDSNNCLSPPTACKTIGHAIFLASPGDSIIVAAATYSENLNIGISLNLMGSGASTAIIDGGGLNRVITVSNASAEITLSKITIRNGSTKTGNGGGIWNVGKLTIANVTISSNASRVLCGTGCNASGGGISNDGILNILNSTVTGNGVIVSCLHGGCRAYGGGISNRGQLTMSNSTVSSNSVGGLGLSVNYTFGGGVFNTGTLVIGHSTVSGNVAMPSGAGGGIVNQGGTLTINDSTVGENTGSSGGGIENNGGLTINRSTLSTNRTLVSSGGGIENSGTLAINNGTMYGNVAANDCVQATQCGGGAIFNSGTVTISNMTFGLNSTQGTFGGGIFNYAGTTTVQNSIFDNLVGNCSGAISSKGYNLSSDNTCNFNGPGDLNNHDPLLGPLQNNGGPTNTMALLPGSPAIDAGNPAGCKDAQGNLLKTDQRGMPRPDLEDKTGCDMGAYEGQTNQP